MESPQVHLTDRDSAAGATQSGADVGAPGYSRYMNSGFVDFPNHVLTIPGSVVHERLGVLHEAIGDSASAVTHYAEFVRHWADADLDQQPRVERAKERILALGGRIGPRSLCGQHHSLLDGRARTDLQIES